MKIMKKSHLFVTVITMVVLLFTSMSSTVSAAKNSDDEFTVRVKGIEFVIPYNKDEVTIEKSVTDNVGLVEVFDKETEEFLQNFKVEDEVSPQTNTLNNVGMLNYTNKTVSSSRDDNGLISTLYARMTIYNSGSFRQIDEVSGTWWGTSSGSHTLENTNSNAISTSGQWPTIEVEVDGFATIQIEIETSTEASWEAAGFSVGVAINGTYYARKDIFKNFRYSVY